MDTDESAGAQWSKAVVSEFKEFDFHIPFSEKHTLDDQDMLLSSKSVERPSDEEALQDLSVKIHIRRAGRDSWTYLGRAYVSQDISGQSHRIGAHYFS